MKTVSRQTRAPQSLLSLMIAGGMLVLAVTMPVKAADKPAQESMDRLEEIIVSARKREERLLDAPVAVTALSARMIDLRKMQSVAEVTNYAPNVQFDGAASESGGGSSSQISIRGIGQTDYAITVEPGVGVYLDGVYIGKSMGSLMDAVDLERIEVLRGPQGTLFGKNTVGGAILLTSKRPSAEPEFGLELTTGRYDRFDVNSHFNVPVSDRLRLRFSGASFNRDGYVKRVLDGGHQGDKDSLTGRILAELDVTDKLLATLSVDGTRTREQSPGQITLAVDETAFFAGLHNTILYPACDPGLEGNTARFSNPDCVNSQYVASLDSLKTTNTGPNQSDSDVWGTSLTLDWDVGGTTLKSITAYRRVSVDVMQELVGIPSYQSTIGQDIDLKQFTQEFQVGGSAMNGRLTYLVGAFYLSEKGNQVFPVLLEPVEFTSGGSINNESYAGFGQISYDITDRLSLTVGARYSHEEKRYRPEQQIDYVPAVYQPFWDFLAEITGNTFLVQEGLPLFPRIWVKDKNGEFTPSVTLDYHFRPDVMGYFTYSKGFKGGGFTLRGFPPAIPGVTTTETNPAALIPSFAPETAEMFELGAKGEFLGGRLRLSAAGFITNYDDLQLTANSGYSAFVPVLINGGKARIKGIEVETEIQISDWLALNAGLGYLDSKYRSLSADAIAAGASLSKEIPSSPKWTTTVGTTIDLMDNDRGHIFLRADYSTKSGQYKTVANDPVLYQKGYELLNASLTYETSDQHWAVTMGAANLTDELYVVSGVANAGIGYAQAVVSRPREWLLSLRYRY